MEERTSVNACCNEEVLARLNSIFKTNWKKENLELVERKMPNDMSGERFILYISEFVLFVYEVSCRFTLSNAGLAMFNSCTDDQIRQVFNAYQITNYFVANDYFYFTSNVATSFAIMVD